MDPYRILDITEEADDDLIKQAYLAKVREHPPDRDPEMFKRIRAAYEMVRTLKDRLRHRLFCTEMPDLEGVVEVLLEGRARRRPALKDVRKILASGLQSSSKANVWMK